MTTTIYPEAGKLSEVAKKLLELADDQRVVKFTGTPRQGLVVPDELAEKYEASLKPKKKAAKKAATHEEGE